MITISKRNEANRVTWQYTGRELARDETSITIEAFFNRADMPFQGTTFKNGDRFIESFFFDRWYNIFEIHDRDDDEIKGWYCNIGKPATWDDEDAISYMDLALDLWVSAKGEQVVLDEDEFEAANLDPVTRSHALEAMEALKIVMRERIL